MSTVEQRLEFFEQRLNAAVALIQGSDMRALLYVMHGNGVRYGCKITTGLATAGLTLALEGAASGDSHVNPNATSTPARVEDYANIALVYDAVFLSKNRNTNALEPTDTSLVIGPVPTDAGYGRYDIVYLYVTSQGPGIGILAGTASTAAFTDFGATGIRGGAYPALYDPAGLPHGAMPVARVYVQTGDTGITNARIVDLRTFIP